MYSGDDFSMRFRAADTRPLILDGASGTELERLGAHYATPLWSAELLDTAPSLIARMHDAYLAAGADVIESVSYQATFPGFRAAGYTDEQAEQLLVRSWELAADAVVRHRTVNTETMVFAASAIGPFGAYLADGSEYTGAYAVAAAALQTFHAERIAVLYAAGCRLFAVETIPRLDEALIIAQILRDYPDADWWLSFTLAAHGDEPAIADGTELSAVLGELPRAGNPPVGVGVNCCAPSAVPPALLTIRSAGWQPLAYPNTGEVYESTTGSWRAQTEQAMDDDPSFARAARRWTDSGARTVGGCCRTTPMTIGAVAQALRQSPGTDRR